MRSVAVPKIDKRRVDDLLYDLVKGIPQYFPEWKAPQGFPEDTPVNRRKILELADDPQDFGMAALKLAARMGEIIIEQLNRVPEKNFLAFLDLLGIDLLSPRSARAPLTFFLAEKAPVDVFVPRGTKVGVAKADDVVFETEEDLVVARASLSRVYSLNPEQDRFADIRELLTGSGSDAKGIFRAPQAAPTWPLIEHALYLGHSRLFARASAAGVPVGITIGLAGGSLGQLEWQYSSGEDGWNPDQPVAGSSSSISLSVSDIQETKVRGYDDQGNLTEKSSYWVRAKTADPLTANLRELPIISSITAQITINKSNLAPDFASLNNVPIDFSKDFFPFGERPRFNDTFYIASSEVFSKSVFGTGTYAVTLEVLPSDLPSLRADPTRPVELSWEYWNGNTWRPIGRSSNAIEFISGSASYPSSFQDRSKAFTTFPATPTRITFNGPSDWDLTEINGEKNYWIRVRIIGGDYGKEAEYQTTTSLDLDNEFRTIESEQGKRTALIDLLRQKGLLDAFQYVPATFRPPSLKSLTLRYDYTESVGQSDFTILTVNDFAYRQFSKDAFSPFVQAAEQLPALYLGFDNVLARPVQGTPLSLFLQVTQPRYEQKQNAVVPSPMGLPPIVVWRYWDGAEWARLAVEDETHNLTAGGLVRFIAPPALTERALFGERLLWIKAVVEAGAYTIAPRLQGIFLNTVWARQGVTFRDQVLGSSNGEPSQIFSFSKSPVLEGQAIEVREPALPSEAEQQQIIAGEGPDAIRTIKDEAGNITEVWVRWHQVGTFSLSGPGDRHYVLDRIAGRLLFGDGVRGLIPPPGKDSIKAAVYRSGGGAIGNTAPDTITELKTTFPFVDKVVNHEASSGGSDQQDIDRVTLNGPRVIKSRDRAVTAEDFEWLALQASSEVAKARCLPLTKADSLATPNTGTQQPGWITVIVVPQGQEDQLLPTRGLIQTVKDYLAARSLTTLADRIEIVGPRYIPITVDAEVIPKRIVDAKAVEKRVLDSLKTFLHPLRGGARRDGWDFGRHVYLSEIASVIQGTEGVDRVRRITLKQGEQRVQDRIAIEAGALPASGDHRVVAVGS
jgi:baseplate J-like protein